MTLAKPGGESAGSRWRHVGRRGFRLTQINKVAMTAGFLEGCEIEFAAGLNCIIGARGTCKSTIVESIRFAFDRGDRRVSELVGKVDAASSKSLPHFGLIRTTLGAGSVRCEVESSEASFVVEREVDDVPRIYADGVREHADRQVLQQVEIFSQGDLQRIADSDDLRIELVDRPNAAQIARLLGDRKLLAQQLAAVGPELRTTRSHVLALKQQLQPLAQFREELSQSEKNAPIISPELDSERVAYERRERIIDLYGEVVLAREQAIQQTRMLTNLYEQARSALGGITRFAGNEDIAAAIGEASTLVEALGAAVKAMEAARQQDLASGAKALRQRFDDANDKFYRLRQQEQSANETLKKQHQLKRQIEHMDKLAKEIDTVYAREAELMRSRDQLRVKIAAIDSEIYALRVAQIDAINSEHGESVYLTLDQGTSSSGYADTLFKLLAGSRIRAQEDVAAALAATFPPAALIDIVESGSGQRFADVLGRDLGQMNRVSAHLADSTSLHALEIDPPAARLDITMFDQGQPKPVETLSKGQKATALLPLILRSIDHPLIIDQPEDDLDNSFIFKSLVRTIRTLKKTRQLIFVTHNANIPVLGDAERVIVMTMETPTRAHPPLTGTVEERKEDVLHLLEGGAQAFREREVRYRDLLGD